MLIEDNRQLAICQDESESYIQDIFDEYNNIEEDEYNNNSQEIILVLNNKFLNPWIYKILNNGID